MQRTHEQQYIANNIMCPRQMKKVSYNNRVRQYLKELKLEALDRQKEDQSREKQNVEKNNKGNCQYEQMA